MILKTQNLILRPWEIDDAEELYHHAKNPKIGPIVGWSPHKNVENSLEIIQSVFARDETYAVTLNGQIIGCVALLIHPDGNYYWGDNNAELGYWIAEDFWGNNYAYEASEKLLEHAFEDLKLNKIFASFKKSNYQSKRVLEKLGFKYFDELQNIDYAGKSYLEIVMSLKNNMMS